MKVEFIKIHPEIPSFVGRRAIFEDKIFAKKLIKEGYCKEIKDETNKQSSSTDTEQ